MLSVKYIQLKNEKTEAQGSLCNLPEVTQLVGSKSNIQPSVTSHTTNHLGEVGTTVCKHH